IIAWGSETAVIPYFCNAEGKKRRYFMDIWMKDSSGQEFFIEIKPKKETQPPVKPAHLTTAAKKRFMNEIYTWSVNTDKWKAAQSLAEKRGIKFRILTEDGLRALGFKGA
ncbi:TnsA endonuclease N-terminal domain-containing protein, partial [Enterococcus faecalis]